MRVALLIGLFGVLLLISIGCDDSDEPSPSLRGGWDLISYADHGITGVTTGSAIFRDDGTFTILGTVTYPGEPVDSLDVSGTYLVIVNVVRLMTSDGTGSWSMAFSGDRVVLSLIGSAPPTKITLERQP